MVLMVVMVLIVVVVVKLSGYLVFWILDIGYSILDICFLLLIPYWLFLVSGFLFRPAFALPAGLPVLRRTKAAAGEGFVSVHPGWHSLTRSSFSLTPGVAFPHSFLVQSLTPGSDVRPFQGRLLQTACFLPTAQ